MLRLGAMSACLTLLVLAGQNGEQPGFENGFVHLTTGGDLSEWEMNNPGAWRLQEDGTLRGRSDGHSPVRLLLLKGREPGDFELRFEALVRTGAVQFRLRGLGPEADGVAVEINPEKVDILVHHMHFLAAGANRPNRWNEFRLRYVGPNLRIWKSGVPAWAELVSSDTQEKGKLAIALSETMSTDISIKRLRILDLSASPATAKPSPSH